MISSNQRKEKLKGLEKTAIDAEKELTWLSIKIDGIAVIAS